MLCQDRTTPGQWMQYLLRGTGVCSIAELKSGVFTSVHKLAASSTRAAEAVLAIFAPCCPRTASPVRCRRIC